MYATRASAYGGSCIVGSTSDLQSRIACHVPIAVGKQGLRVGLLSVASRF